MNNFESVGQVIKLMKMLKHSPYVRIHINEFNHILWKDILSEWVRRCGTACLKEERSVEHRLTSRIMYDNSVSDRLL